MANGNFISNTDTNLNLYVTWSSTTNVNTNQSTVTANVYMRSYTISATALADSYITINANKKSFGGISLNKTSSSLTDTLLTTHTVTVDHNTDGTKSITIKANLEFNGTVSGKYLSDITASKTVDLDNIPRASSLTVASSVNTGSSLTATIAPASSTFTHLIEYYVDGAYKGESGTITAGTTIYSRTIEHSWLPSTNSTTMIVRLHTYNNGIWVGSVDKYVTVSVPSTIIPKVNSITSTLINGLGGYYVEGKSQVKLAVSATAGEGSTLSSYVFSGQNIFGNASSTTSTSSTITSEVIRANGTLTYSVVAKDGRPYRQSEPKSTSITVYPYSNPQISSITAQRCLADGTLSNDGTYAKITVKASYSPVNGANTRVVTLYSSKDNYATGTVVLAATNTDDTYVGVYSSGFSIGSSYTIRAVITDKYNTGTAIQKSVTLGVAERTINVAKYGNGVAIGGLSTVTSSAESGLFQCNWDAQFAKNMSLDGTLYCNSVIQTKGATEISPNSNLNDYTSPGTYMIGADEKAKTILNCPAQESGVLIVYHCAGNNDGSPWSYLSQEYTTISGNTYHRFLYTAGTANIWYYENWALKSGRFLHDIKVNGYQKLPSGLIIQWGSQNSALAVSGNYNITTGNITLPIAFPNNFVGVFCNINQVDDGSLSGHFNLTAKQNGLTSFTWSAYNYWNNWGSSILFSWFVIGY